MTESVSTAEKNSSRKRKAQSTAPTDVQTLQTKPVREPVKVERVEVVRDSLVYRDRVQTVTVEVEKKLTWWHRFRLTLGNI